MPTYEYECGSCGGHFEYFQSMSEKPKEGCESCGGKLTKLLSAGTGLIFKGSGFYITDYKAKSGGEGSGASEGGGSKGDSSSGSEVKPSKPSETKGSETKPAGSEAAPTKTTESK